MAKIINTTPAVVGSLIKQIEGTQGADQVVKDIRVEGHKLIFSYGDSGLIKKITVNNVEQPIDSNKTVNIDVPVISVEQVKTSGIEIAKITIDGETKSIYQQDNNDYAKVRQYPMDESTADGGWPLLTKGSTSTSASYSTEYTAYSPNVWINPIQSKAAFTGFEVSATKFKGDLEGTADKVATVTAVGIGGTKRPIYFTGADSSKELVSGKLEYESSGTNPFAYDNTSETLFVHHVNEGGTLLSEKYLSIGQANLSGTLRIVPTSGSYTEGIRIGRYTNNWATLMIGVDPESTSGMANGWFIGRNPSGRLIASKVNSTDSTALFYGEYDSSTAKHTMTIPHNLVVGERLTWTNTTWNAGGNISLNATANNQEWSFDINRNGKTGCYWHVWDSALSTMLKVNADNGKVSAPYNFVGNLEGTADTAKGYTSDGAIATALAGKANIVSVTGGTALQMNDSKNNRNIITVYDDKDSNNYGSVVVIEGAGNMFLGAGESASALNNAIGINAGESMYISSDGDINFVPNCQTIANRKTVYLNSGPDLHDVRSIYLRDPEYAYNGAYTGNTWGNSVVEFRDVNDARFMLIEPFCNVNNNSMSFILKTRANADTIFRMWDNGWMDVPGGLNANNSVVFSCAGTDILTLKNRNANGTAKLIFKDSNNAWTGTIESVMSSSANRYITMLTNDGLGQWQGLKMDGWGSGGHRFRIDVSDKNKNVYTALLIEGSTTGTGCTIKALTPSTTANDTQIATTKWVRDKLKTFTKLYSGTVTSNTTNVTVTDPSPYEYICIETRQSSTAQEIYYFYFPVAELLASSSSKKLGWRISESNQSRNGTIYRMNTSSTTLYGFGVYYLVVSAIYGVW